MLCFSIINLIDFTYIDIVNIRLCKKYFTTFKSNFNDDNLKG